jgi:hypothetical protein
VLTDYTNAPQWTRIIISRRRGSQVDCRQGGVLIGDIPRIRVPMSAGLAGVTGIGRTRITAVIICRPICYTKLALTLANPHEPDTRLVLVCRTSELLATRTRETFPEAFPFPFQTP